MIKQEVVIVSALRTAIGSFGGVFKETSAVELGSHIVKAILKETGIKPNLVDEVILGNVLHAGLGQNVARQVAVHGGIPEDKNAFTVDMVCGSGLKAIQLGVQSILTGASEVVIAGGTENMSQGAYVVNNYRWGSRLGTGKVVDTVVNDGLTDAFNGYHMGITAENIAEKYKISRQRQDEFALNSQMKAKIALENHVFATEIVPIVVPQRRREDLVVSVDEYPKPQSTIEKLNNLPSAFLGSEEGTVTAGNASGINDGAAAVLLMTREKAEKLNLEVLASVVSFASAGVSPTLMGTGPIPATKKALTKANLMIEEIDLVEANEAFASQALQVIEALKLNPEIVNVNGGAIALGHPIGASGARILVSLVHELKRRNKRYGLATLCIGGGQGTSLIIKNNVI